jgi:RimJ/RimL family protein N-acetyltransferase
MDYLFTSDRLGFRNWKLNDLDDFHQMNANAEVMHFFPSTLSREDSKAMLKRMQQLSETRGYCYFATERLSDKKLIGMIGLGYKDFEADFTPCVDIGWRLDTPFWGKGYATEGAEACLDFGLNMLKIKDIYSIAPAVNLPSIAVMEKIGLKKHGVFNHPQLTDYLHLVECVVYK